MNDILSFDKKIIGFEFLCIIWDQLVKEPLGGMERDLTFKWLKELSEVNESSLFEVL